MTDVPLSAVAADAGASTTGVAGTARSVAQSLARPIRLAYVVHGFDVGGIERCVARLVNHLDPERFQPAIICLTRSGKAAEWITRGDVAIFELQKRPGNDWSAVRRLSRLLRQQQFHIVHSHNWGTLIETTLARRWAGVPVHVHSERGTVLGALDLSSTRRWLRGTAMRWALIGADAVISNAHATAERVEASCGYSRARITIIPNGVESLAMPQAPAVRREVRRQLGIPESAFVVGSVGRLVAVKNFPMAIAALAQLRREPVDVHFLLVGDGPERDALQLQAKAAGVADRVHFPGHCTEVERYYAAMDVYVNCSLSEGLSQSLIEALSAGLPLVVTDVGDSRHVADGECPCGVVVPSGAASELAGVLLTLLQDDSRRQRFSASARQRFEQDYALERMVAKHASVYCAVLEHALLTKCGVPRITSRTQVAYR
jgi:glycosyltransferase involved in cell wall biosynthesis